MATEKLYKVYRYWIYLDPDPKPWSYIGCTSLTLERRADGKFLSSYLRIPKFGEAIRSYGPEAFVYEVLEDGLTKEQAADRERYYIQKFDSINHGFNMSTGGLGRPDTFHSVETKKKMRESHLNHPGYSKPVLQYSLDGQLIARYPSIMEAERQTGIRHTGILGCLTGRYKFSGNSKWEYEQV